MRITIAALALLVACLGTVTANDVADDDAGYVAELEVGQEFIVAPLPDLDGKPRSVRDYEGKKLAIHIFASW
ncbi:MAG: hypothetical protein H6839_14350 [Planctomycetes bacterium]|nr:hypothetical protein [Planctomycetota bacterium]